MRCIRKWLELSIEQCSVNDAVQCGSLVWCGVDHAAHLVEAGQPVEGAGLLQLGGEVPRHLPLPLGLLPPAIEHLRHHLGGIQQMGRIHFFIYFLL